MPPRHQTTGDSGNDPVMWLLGGAGIIVMVWLTGHEWIAHAIMHVRLLEAQVLFFDREAQRTIYQWIAQRHPRDVGLNELYQSGQVVGYYGRWVVAALIAVVYGWRFATHPGRQRQFRRSYTVESLAYAMAPLYPMLLPVLRLRLHEKSIDDPVHGMRMLPRVYARQHGMLKRMSEISADVPRDTLGVIDAKQVLVLPQCRRVFAQQLGQPWTGIAALPTYEAHLLVAFAVQLAVLTDDANDLALRIIEELAVGADAAFATTDLSKIHSETAARLAADALAAPAVVAVLVRHGWRRTVLMGVLEAARVGGVLPPAWFRWLKAVDRVTWYALCDLGTAPSSVESAGVRAHYLMEQAAGRPLGTPSIDSAVDGLREYLTTHEETV